MFNFKKRMVVGVSVSPELGLEVAQIDFLEKKVLKYARAPLAYDFAQRSVADVDIFKETLQELLQSLMIPKGADIVLNIPSATFDIAEYPASLTEERIKLDVEEKLLSLPFYEKKEPLFDVVKLPLATMQFNRYLSASASMTNMSEIAMYIEDLGYNLICIDSTVNSILNALIYNERIELEAEKIWTLLIVDNSCCRVLTMQDSCYLESFEERISIGAVLGDEENYSTVVSAVNPILEKSPTDRLYIISNTSIISSRKLANNLNFKGQIIHHEANQYAESSFLEFDEEVIDAEEARTISLEVIGAAIRREFASNYVIANLNLFNSSMGDVYFRAQPPEVKIGDKTIVLSNERLFKLASIYLVALLMLVLFFLVPISAKIKGLENDIAKVNKNIKDVEGFLKNNNDISTSLFDEGDEIKMGLANNKKVYTYYSVIGTEIPEKLWLTGLHLGKKVIISGQADNIESVYSFFKNIRDYNLDDKLKLQKLGLASSKKITNINTVEDFDTESILTSMNADFYEFKFSNVPEEEVKQEAVESKKSKKSGSAKKTSTAKKSVPKLGNLD